jgi:hypothetical protein
MSSALNELRRDLTRFSRFSAVFAICRLPRIASSVLEKENLVLESRVGHNQRAGTID